MPPVTRSQGQVSDQRMADMCARDPDTDLRAARAANRAAARVPATQGHSRLERLPQELHDRIAPHLPPRDLAALSRSSRPLHQAYQPHADWSRAVQPLAPGSPSGPPELFDLRLGLTDADMLARLKSFLGTQPADASAETQPFDTLPATYRARALASAVRFADVLQPGPRSQARAAIRPHVLALPREHFADVVRAAAHYAWSAPHARWCLDLIGERGPESHGPALRTLTRGLPNFFRDGQELTAQFGRMAGFARQLDRLGDPQGHQLRAELTETWHRLPDSAAAAERLLTDVADRPAPERLDIYLALAASLRMMAHQPHLLDSSSVLAPDAQAALARRLQQASADLPDAARETVARALPGG